MQVCVRWSSAVPLYPFFRRPVPRQTKEQLESQKSTEQECVNVSEHQCQSPLRMIRQPPME